MISGAGKSIRILMTSPDEFLTPFETKSSGFATTTDTSKEVMNKIENEKANKASNFLNLTTSTSSLASSYLID